SRGRGSARTRRSWSSLAPASRRCLRARRGVQVVALLARSGGTPARCIRHRCSSRAGSGVRMASEEQLEAILGLRDDLRDLELELIASGDRVLARVVKRAYREIEHPAFTGALNTAGVGHGAVRE